MSRLHRLGALAARRVPKRLKLSRVGRSVKQRWDGLGTRVRPPIVESVQAWCEERPEIECTTIRAREVVSRRAPRTLEPSVDERFFRIAGEQTTVPEKYLARIPGARLVGQTGLVVLPDGSFTSEVTFSESQLVQQRGYSTPLPKRTHAKPGSYFSLFSLWAHRPNYYHWIHDAMLRLHLVLPHLPDDVRFVVPANLQQFQLDALAVLGIGPERLCRFSGAEMWELETLLFAPPTTSSGTNSPAALAWYRDAAWSAFGLRPTPGSAGRRIYISRRQTKYRRIVNEPEVERVLQAHGFETYLPEELSFREQVELMSDAEAIASASGAALTNILFAPPGAKIFVMVEPVQISVYFWTMSEAAGHEYWYAVGETVPGMPAPYDADLSMPPDKVARTVEAMLGPAAGTLS